MFVWLRRKVEVETNNNHTQRNITNVIAILKGSLEPGIWERLMKNYS